MIRPLALAVLVLAGAACGSGSESGDGHDHGDSAAQFDEADATTRISVDAADFAFQGLPPSAAGPNVLFTVKNTGKVDHELMITGPDSEPVGGVEPFGPGGTKTLAIKLRPGAYTVECLVKQGDATHADLGMKATLTVT